MDLNNCVFIGDDEKKLLIGNIHATYHDENKKWNELRIIKDKLKKENEKDYKIIVGGDFNVCYEAMKTTYDDFYVDGEDGSWFTTVSKDNKGFSLSSDYDHFIYTKNIVKKKIDRLLKDGDKSITICNRSFTNSKDYAEEISDHLPLILSVEIGE